MKFIVTAQLIHMYSAWMYISASTGRSVRVMDLAEIVTNQFVRTQNEGKPWTLSQISLRYLIVTV